MITEHEHKIDRVYQCLLAHISGQRNRPEALAGAASLINRADNIDSAQIADGVERAIRAGHLTREEARAAKLIA